MSNRLTLLKNRVLRLPESLRKRVCWRKDFAAAQAELSRLVRELPTTEMMLTIPVLFRGTGYYESLELRQNMLELLGLVKALQSISLDAVCEIGTLRGGTLFVWCQLAAPSAHLISIDLPGAVSAEAITNAPCRFSMPSESPASGSRA
jgi:hypothetical protein